MNKKITTPEEVRLGNLVVNPNMADLPARRVGSWEVVHTGSKTSLMHDRRGEVMSNEEHEIHSAACYASTASGDCIVLGLGLGLVVRMLLARPEVERVAVVEIDNQVIDLVGDYFKADKRVTIRQGDAFNPKCVRQHRRRYPNARSVWADVWDKADGDSYSQRLALTARWAGVSEQVVCWGMHRSERDYTTRFHLR